MKLKYSLIWISVSLVLIFACTKETPSLDTESYSLNYPSYIPPPVYDFSKNKITKEGFELGKLLFYDPILSRDSSVSCATCHAQVHAFADHGTSVSTGIDNKIGVRNSPPIFNLAWMTNFMWDGGVNHIEVMPLAPIMNPLEMDESMKNLVVKLNRSSRYQLKFKQAFGKEDISDDLILKAIVQFMGSITSFDSKYDKMKKGEYTFNNDESNGYELFKKHCNSCHIEPMFTNYVYANNGLDSVFKDFGRYLITQESSDKGKFKVPSLRNVYLTNPYMHDGRFQSLYEVLDHYSSAVKPSLTLDPNMKLYLNLSSNEKNQIVAFLKTLSDYTLIGNTKFSEP